jgi:hypothetical protein
VSRAEIAALNAQMAALQAEVEGLRAEKKKGEDEAQSVAENNKRLTAERDAALAKAAAASPAPSSQPATTAPPDKSADFAKGLASMFKGEEGKKMLRSQSEFGTRMVYGDFIKTLDPSISDAVMTLLTDRQTALAAAGLEAMSSGDPAAASAKMKELKEEYDKKLRAMVGDAKMTEMANYERGAGDRMMFTQVESQFAAAGTPLTPEQRSGVLGLMQQERLKLPPTAFERGNENPAEAMQAMQDEKAVADWLAREEQMNASVVAQASKVLSPDQVLTLEKSFKQMSEMKKFGLNMWKAQMKK